MTARAPTQKINLGIGARVAAIIAWASAFPMILNALARIAIVSRRFKRIAKGRVPKSITEWGLDRAAGTWGGYQAAAPRDNRQCLAGD
jgi:hypothetical protein